MIIVATGANLPGPLGQAQDTLRCVPALLGRLGIGIARASDIYETAPIGPAGQGSYFNAVVVITTDLMPLPLLARLQQAEASAGRRHGRRWSARALDLDLVAFHGLVKGWDDQGLPCRDRPRPALRGGLILPHPGLHLRPFVVRPLLDVAPFWHHPLTGETAFTMWQRLKHQAGGQVLRCQGPLMP